MSHIVFVRSETDPVESGLSVWAHLLLSSCTARSALKLVDLRALHVTRSSVSASVQTADLAIFYMHGQPDSLGHPVTLVDSTNIACLKATVVIAFSCMAGEQFGPHAVAAGARAFMGFDDLLTNIDTLPTLFGGAAQLAMQPFVLGVNSIDSVRMNLASNFAAIENHYRVGAGKHDVDAGVIWMAAHINRRGLVVHGDTSATL
jgi:hypothetical protein